MTSKKLNSEFENIEINENEIILKFGRIPYRLNWNELETERSLLNQCYSLIHKEWMTKLRLRLFISLVSEYRGFALDEF